MSQPSLDIDQFAFLLRRVAGATSLTILAQDDSTVFSVGDPVDLDAVVSGLRELPTGEVTLVEDLPPDLGAPLRGSGRLGARRTHGTDLRSSHGDSGAGRTTRR